MVATQYLEQLLLPVAVAVDSALQEQQLTALDLLEVLEVVVVAPTALELVELEPHFKVTQVEMELITTTLTQAVAVVVLELLEQPDHLPQPEVLE
jgi:hypothetical protein